MKCAVAIVLAFIGMVVANPSGIGPYGLGIASPLLVPSPVSIASTGLINHGYGKLVVPTIPILKTVQLVKSPVLSVPLSVGSPGYLGGYGLGLGKGLGGWGLGGLGYDLGYGIKG